MAISKFKGKLLPVFRSISVWESEMNTLLEGVTWGGTSWELRTLPPRKSGTWLKLDGGIKFVESTAVASVSSSSVSPPFPSSCTSFPEVQPSSGSLLWYLANYCFLLQMCHIFFKAEFSDVF
jgi:hypothetical protein